MMPFPMTMSDFLPKFHGHDIIQHHITRKWHTIELCYNSGQIVGLNRIFSIERRRLQRCWTTPKSFQDHAII